MPLEESIIRRHALIKYIYNIGLQQSYGPEPLCSIALLSFHDSAELFLHLSSEYLNSGGNDPSFMKYFDFINQKLPNGKEVTQKESMRRLSKARVSLKHNGTLPAKTELDAFRATIVNFFEENSRLSFDVDFSDISLIHLVYCQNARTTLEESEGLLKQGKIEDSMELTAVAFSQLLGDYANKVKDKFGKYPFSFNGSVNSIIGFSASDDSDLAGEVESLASDVESAFSEVDDCISELQDTLEIMSIGIDYRKYMKFYLLTPNVSTVKRSSRQPTKVYGDYNIYYPAKKPKYISPKEDAQFCIDFIIESAIILQEFNF
jgi:hypothetical protein